MNDVQVGFVPENIILALKDARGDLFVASQMLGVTPVRLQKAVAASDELQATFLAARGVKMSPEFKSATAEEFHAAVESRLAIGRVVGLDSLIALASMPIDENSAQNQVKLAAASRLAGATDGTVGGGDIADTLRALAEQYQTEAPRIRVTRETIEIQAGGERVINPAE